ncbi:hypothetical protein TBCH5v1_2376 [Thermococcus barophilus]|uniref:Uncharacterized protein n=1 Tax=Thermococcus barophilus TaxID=55802 RepID=A0A0S1XEQ6_THEBA|nr:hypothetical protein TBCH5v1_2376 [Thermococcus barophilus]
MRFPFNYELLKPEENQNWTTSEDLTFPFNYELLKLVFSSDEKMNKALESFHSTMSF